jgi:hypothetical protein
MAWKIPRNCGDVIYSEYVFKMMERWVVAVQDIAIPGKEWPNIGLLHQAHPL